MARVLLAAAAGVLLALSVPFLLAEGAPQDPPLLSFNEGDDFPAAERAGVAARIRITPDGNAYHVDLTGFPDATVIIDRLLHATAQGGLHAYGFETTEALHGGGEMKLRFWTGPTPPDSDAAPGVCAVLDLARAGPTEGTCTASAHVQTVLHFPEGAVGGSGTFRAVLLHGG